MPKGVPISSMLSQTVKHIYCRFEYFFFPAIFSLLKAFWCLVCKKRKKPKTQSFTCLPGKYEMLRLGTLNSTEWHYRKREKAHWSNQRLIVKISRTGLSQWMLKPSEIVIRITQHRMFPAINKITFGARCQPGENAFLYQNPAGRAELGWWWRRLNGEYVDQQ